MDRCDAGLFTLQMVDLILVRLVNMGNRQATAEPLGLSPRPSRGAARIGKLMDVKGVKLPEIQKIVMEYCPAAASLPSLACLSR